MPSMSFSAPLTGPVRPPMPAFLLASLSIQAEPRPRATRIRSNLKVQALYLKKAVPPTGPNGSIAPKGIVAKLTITDQSPLAEAFSSPGTYNSYFRPTHPGNATTGGAYGFHIKIPWGRG